MKRWAPARPFPPYAFVPGRAPHPTRDPRGHSFGVHDTTPARLAPEAWRANEDYLHGVDLYNAGYAWEAHEAWERLWALEPAGADVRVFLQALIQCAAAVLKIAMDEPAGAQTLSASAVAKLHALSSRVEPRYMGVDVRGFALDFAVFSAASPTSIDARPRLELADDSMSETYHVDPDIARAETLPGRFYSNRIVYERTLERVLSTSWQLVEARLDTLERGALAPFTLLEGSLNEPLMLANAADGDRRVLSNVCTHRGAVLIDEPCRRTAITCRYHGRRFALDGSFQSMPEFEEAIDFPRPADSLPRLPLATWGALAFTSIAPRVAFEDVFGDLRARLGWLPLDDLVLRAELTRDYEFDAHWALYCENYLEGFHIPFVHRALNAAIEYETYTTELLRWSSVQVGLAKPGQPAFEPPHGAIDHGKRVAGYYAFVYPNLMLNFYPWGLSLNVVKPAGLARTKVTFQTWTWRGAQPDSNAGPTLHDVEMEDESVVTSVQRGVRSRSYDRGRYSPARERGVHHFHRLLVAALARES